MADWKTSSLSGSNFWTARAMYTTRSASRTALAATTRSPTRVSLRNEKSRAKRSTMPV